MGGWVGGWVTYGVEEGLAVLGDVGGKLNFVAGEEAVEKEKRDDEWVGGWVGGWVRG